MTWKTTEIGNVINVRSSKRIFASEYSDTGIPFYRSKEIGELSKNENTKSDLFISRERYEEIKNKFGVPQKGDLLLTSVGSIGNTWIVDDREFYYKDGNLTQLECVDDISMKFIQYYFKTNLFWSSIKSNVTGTAYSALTITKIKKLQIPLPPLPVQQKIASILDTANALKQKDKALIAKYDELSQSLFLDMFGDPVNNQKRWKVKKFSNIFNSLRYGVSTPPVYSSEGIPFVRATNVKNGSVSTKGMKYISCSEALKISKCKLSLGDLIVVRSGVNTGDCCRISPSYEDSYGGFDMIIEINEPFSTFFNFLLNTKAGKAILKPLTRRAGQPHLNSKQISSLNLINPPIALQNQFAERIQSIEQQKQQAQSSLQKSEDLFNCLLQKAFKGELVC